MREDENKDEYSCDFCDEYAGHSLVHAWLFSKLSLAMNYFVVIVRSRLAALSVCIYQ